MKKGLIISLFLVISTYPIVAQVKRTVIPMDTTYTPYQTWLSIRGNYPQATIARYRLPEGVLANENLIYCTLKNTPYGDRSFPTRKTWQISASGHDSWWWLAFRK
jgi:hypothetical protein